MSRVLICPDCRERIPFNGLKWPNECPGCGKDTSLPDTDEVCLPAFISPKKAAVDKVYRDIEAASERRAEAAAELAGVPVSEMSGLKITNLNDRRDAEIAAMPVNNSVSQAMQVPAGQPSPWGFQGGQGLGYSGAVATGPNPNAGARAMHSVRQHYTVQNNAAAASDRPALEMSQPGYRRRA